MTMRQQNTNTTPHNKSQFANLNTLEIVTAELESRIAGQQLDLPMLPKVAGAVIAMTQDQSADMAGLAQLIQQDQALASRVMKIANSPVYRGVNPMSSLQQAIARMGMKAISEMALAASVGAKVFNVAGYEAEVSSLWKHSIAAAGWAKEIARIRRRNVESAFMCGLLHQIGKPVTLQALVDIQNSKGAHLPAEDMHQLIDKYHVTVGCTLGRDWELPAMVVESMGFYQKYREAEQFGREAMIAAGSDLLADELLGEEEMNMERLLDSDVMEDLNLYDEDIELLITKEEDILSMVEVMAI